MGPFNIIVKPIKPTVGENQSYVCLAFFQHLAQFLCIKIAVKKFSPAAHVAVDLGVLGAASFVLICVS